MPRGLMLLLGGLCLDVLAPAQTVQPAPKPSAEAEFYWPSDTWEAIAPEKAGFDAKRLGKAAEYVMQRHTASFVVLHGGRILVERYPEPGDRTAARKTWSVTMGMASVLVGMALDAGKLESLEQPVSDFVPKWRYTDRGDVTLRHVLSMTSGLSPSGLSRRPSGDQLASYARMSLAHEPGSFWAYDSMPYHMLFRILEKATKERFETWCQRRLFDPLGMKGATWFTLERGGFTNYYNLRSDARGLARFGLCLLRKGRWRGEQIVSRAYLEKATSPSSKLNPAFGLLFWLNQEDGRSAFSRRFRRLYPGAPRDLFALQGRLGQWLIMIPSLDLVFVRQGDSPGEPSFSARFVRHVLSALPGRPREEIRAPRKLPPEFRPHDRDGDGRLDRNEFAKTDRARRIPALFARLDKGQDGYVTPAEIEVLEAGR